MVAINLAILLPLLPLLGMASAGSHAPAHQRHRRHSGLVPVHQGARQAARDNVGHAEAHKVVKKNVKKRTKTCRKKDSSFTASATSTDSADSYVATSTSSIDGQAAWAKGVSLNLPPPPRPPTVRTRLRAGVAATVSHISIVKGSFADDVGQEKFVYRLLGDHDHLFRRLVGCHNHLFIRLVSDHFLGGFCLDRRQRQWRQLGRSLDRHRPVGLSSVTKRL